MEHDEDDGKHDEAMDRSPTPERPERPKRAVPKRARTTPVVIGSSKEAKLAKDGKASGENDVDVGVLLGEYHHSILHS